jgi:hypothetical protein
LIEIVWIDDGDGILFINVGIAHVFGRVHLHFVGRGNVVALDRKKNRLATRRRKGRQRLVCMRGVQNRNSIG